MGITGENFKDEVQKQIEERQKFFARTNKTDSVITTQNAGAWLRLASSVDLSANSSQFTTNAQYVAAQARVSELTNRLQVNPGSELAQTFVLTGGTAYYDPATVSFEYLQGINTNPSIQGYLNAYGHSGLEYGFKPMPGIQSANVTYYNNGALAKADINIIVNSPHQLDALELLYLRPGYTILLEWGHNNFVNNSGTEETVDTTGYITEPFTKFFDSSGAVDREELQEALAREREKKSFNYDGFYGVITNFSWTLNKDASYKVTLKAITTGAIIESLKIASNFNTTPPPTPVTGSAATTPTAGQSLAQKLQGRKAESDIFYALGEVAEDFQTSVFTPFLFDANVDNILSNLNLFNLQYDTAAGGAKLSSGPPPEYFIPPQGSSLAWKIETSDTEYNSSYAHQAVYITFDALLAHIQANCLLYTGTGRPYIRTEIGLQDSIPMLSIPGRFSGDPNVCIVDFNHLVDTKKSTAENIKFGPIGFNLIRKPFTFTIEMNKGTNQVKFNQRRMADGLSFINSPGISNIVLAPTSSNPSLPATPSQYIGYLNSVHVNIEHIAKTLDDCVDESGETKLIDFLQKIVDGISEALGSINDFKVKYDDKTHTVRIYDQALRSKIPSTAKFRSYGVAPGKESTIIKDLSITTQLSNEMASMIAIGAQANANIISENATAFSEFNLGLIDRVTQVKVDSITYNSKTPFEKFTEVTNNILKYIEAVYPIQGEGFNLNSSNIQTLKKLNKDYCRYLVGHFSNTEVEFETPFIIPFKASVTIPGLSGATIYQKFGMDDLLLPYSYKNKVEYLIINLEHKIENNIWDTTYQAYTIPVPVTSSGASYIGASTTTTATGSTTPTPAAPVAYIPNPVPSLRSTTIFTNAAGTSIPYYIGGRPNQGTHSYINSTNWANWNAYDLHQAPNTYVFAPARMQMIAVKNFGSTVTSTGGLNLLGIGAVFIDLTTGKQLYFAHLGALNDKLKVGSKILEKGEFVGTLAPATTFYPHLHFAIEGTFNAGAKTYTPDLFDTYLKKTATDGVPAGTTPPDPSVASYTKGKGTFR